MQFKKASLSLLLPLLVAACDSSQPTYSASNANSAAPPAVQTPPPAPPPAPVATPPPAPVAAAPPPAPALAPKTPPRPTWRDATGSDRWTASKSQAGKMGAADKIGVGSCDDYVARYRACFNSTNMTREQKGSMRHTLTDQMRQWKTDTQAGKISQVAAACTAADQAARDQFKKVGCTAF